MSQENVEIVKAALAAYNGGEIETALQYVDEEIAWVGPPEWLEKHLYKGHDGVREIAAQWSENFDEYRVDPVEFVDAGDEVVVLALQRGRIKGSSVPIEDPISYVWTMRDGKVVRVQVYFTWDEARAHAGLGE
jgi:ketosteroid isomerase-like protein